MIIFTDFFYLFSNVETVELFEIFATAYIIGGSLVAYQIGYVADKCPRSQFEFLYRINAN